MIYLLHAFPPFPPLLSIDLIIEKDHAPRWLDSNPSSSQAQGFLLVICGESKSWLILSSWLWSWRWSLRCPLKSSLCSQVVRSSRSSHLNLPSSAISFPIPSHDTRTVRRRLDSLTKHCHHDHILHWARCYPNRPSQISCTLILTPILPSNISITFSTQTYILTSTMSILAFSHSMLKQEWWNVSD